MDIMVDGARLFYLPVGPEDGYPLIVLHGGPGLDHTEMHPWLDVLSDRFRLIYLDQRGQGRSQRVDPSTLSLERFARDITALASALGLDNYALLGHSFGAMVSIVHAVNHGDASHYVISHGTASFARSMPEIEQNLAGFEPVELRTQVTESWALEPSARTQEDAARIMEMQMPFHFATVESDAYRRYMEETRDSIYAPEVLAYFSANGYAMEYEDRLGVVESPTLVISAEYDRTCTPRAARDLQAAIPGSEVVIIPDAGHMSYVEQPDAYFKAVREFFDRYPVGM